MKIYNIYAMSSVNVVSGQVMISLPYLTMHASSEFKKKKNVKQGHRICIKETIGTSSIRYHELINIHSDSQIEDFPNAPPYIV